MAIPGELNAVEVPGPGSKVHLRFVGDSKVASPSRTGSWNRALTAAAIACTTRHVGIAVLVVFNLPLIGIRLLTVLCRSPLLVIVVFCCVGLYTLNNNPFDVYVEGAFAVSGYLFYKLGCEAVPLLLGFILGPMMEESLRRAPLISRGDGGRFVTRPLSAGLLVAAVLMILIVVLPSIKNRRDAAFAGD